VAGDWELTRIGWAQQPNGFVMFQHVEEIWRATSMQGFNSYIIRCYFDELHVAGFWPLLLEYWGAQWLGRPSASIIGGGLKPSGLWEFTPMPGPPRWGQTGTLGGIPPWCCEVCVCNRMFLSPSPEGLRSSMSLCLAYLQGVPIKNYPLGKISNFSYCNRFFLPNLHFLQMKIQAT